MGFTTGQCAGVRALTTSKENAQWPNPFMIHCQNPEAGFPRKCQDKNQHFSGPVMTMTILVPYVDSKTTLSCSVTADEQKIYKLPLLAVV